MSHTPTNAVKEAADANARAHASGVPLAAQVGRHMEAKVEESPFATSGAANFQAPQASMLGNQNQTYLNRTYDEYQEQE